MKAGIMQPYLFPYIGYFQLIKAVDTFVIYDDVQYKKGGWINRNRVLMNDEELLWSFSIQQDSFSKNINERFFAPRAQRDCQKFIKTLQMAYGQAPYFEETLEMVKGVFEVMNIKSMKENIALKIGQSIRYLAVYLNLKTEFLYSSNIEKDESKDGVGRVIEIVQRLNANTYINPIGGQKLYNQESFRERNIELFFLKPQKISYPQFSGEFIPWLSIIDVCMFNSREEMGELLESYSLVQ